jgi:iron complex transport system ATP-binding protein
MELLLLLKHLAHKMGKGVLLSTHELGLGLQVSDKVWLVNRNGNLEQAIPEDLILNNRLDNTFGNNHISFHPFSASFELVPDKKLRIQVVGDGLLTACVIRLLKRLGITITHRLTNGDLLIEVNEQNQTIEVLTPEKPTFTSLTSLQIFLTELLND